MTTLDEAIACLNMIHAADPTVLGKLISFRVPCNSELALHPTVQVGLRDGWNEDGSLKGGDGTLFTDQPYEVGFLGVINGLFGVDYRQWGFIYAHFAEDEQLLGFSDGKGSGWFPTAKQIIDVNP